MMDPVKSRQAGKYPIPTLFVVLMFVGACSTPEEPVSAQDRRSGEARELRREAMQLKPLERPPAEPAPTGEAPSALLVAIHEDLERRSGGSRVDFELLRSEAVLWNDGALGCPQPGMFYPQVLINGYRIVIRYRDKDYDYRADDRGGFRLCEPALMR